jgi:hypothetical protein
MGREAEKWRGWASVKRNGIKHIQINDKEYDPDAADNVSEKQQSVL